jgi:large subunit ribosomal protein L23
MLEQINIYDVLKKPILTEKCTRLRESEKKVLVEVADWANKDQISKAVKLLFNVDVCGVNTLKYRGKLKRVRQHLGKRKNTKRAYLTLAKGSDVDLFGLVGQESGALEAKDS